MMASLKRKRSSKKTERSKKKKRHSEAPQQATSDLKFMIVSEDQLLNPIVGMPFFKFLDFQVIFACTLHTYTVQTYEH